MRLIEISKVSSQKFFWEGKIQKHGRIYFVLFLFFISVLSAGDSRSSKPLLVRVGVLSLFTPVEVSVNFDETVPARLIIKGKTIKKEEKSFRILFLNGLMFINGEKADKFIGPARISEFELSIPNRIKRRYYAKLEVFPNGAKSALTLVTEIPIEEYVAGIVFSELGENAPTEAQKAAAVVVRSFVISSLNRHAKDGYDFCDTTHCAVYRGLDGGINLEKSRAATIKTAGVVLTWNGKPVKAFFHSTCGGTTHTPQEVWGEETAYPYRSVKCPYCVGAAHFRWTTKIEKARLAPIFSPEKRTEIDLTWQKNDVRVSFDGRSLLLTREEFRMAVGRKLGWHLILSPWFEFRDLGDVYEFTGRGFGHGVGLCEEGAMEMAHRSFNWKTIVKFYFPRASF